MDVEDPVSTCYLLIGEATSRAIACQIADRFKDCPYVYFIASFGEMLTAVYFLPEAQRWWIELVASQPQLTLGLSRAAVYRSERPSCPTQYRPRRDPQGAGEGTPCGSVCSDCDRYGACLGCPGSMYWRGRPTEKQG